MIKKTIPFIIVSLFLFLSITLFSQSSPVKDRFGLFVSRKGEAELGIVEKDRIFYKSNIESREVVGTGNVILVKKDSEGEFLIKEGETYLYESTTFIIDIFNTLKLLTTLMHGKIESKLSNMDNKYPIIFRTEALEVKTKENTSFILTHNKRNDKSTISVSEGKVKVFSAVKRKECVILSKDQYLEIVAGQELKYVTLPTGVSIIPNCNIDYEDDYLMENLTDDNTGSGENSNNSSGENNTNTDGNNTNGTNTGESGTEGNISDIQMDFVSFSDDGVDLSQSNNNNDTTDENDDDDDDDDNDD